MAMQMHEAFDALMLTPMTRYSVSAGSYDEFNTWVPGTNVSSVVYGVIKAGNKFSQFEEGEALHAEDGGARFSDYRTLYITDQYTIELGDKVGFSGKYFNVLQRSDENVYGFYSYILERSEEWQP